MAKINRVISTLITSAFFMQAGWGLIGPIFVIFITDQIEGGTLAAIGFIAATYWVAKSIVQPFIANYLDVKKGEKDDFNFLIVGMVLANLIPLIYIFVTDVWQVFLLEGLRGICMACVVPTWSGIFTRHIDKGKEALEWGLESTSIGIGAGIAAALGGTAAAFLGFKIVFICAAVLTIVSAFLLVLVRKDISPKEQLPHFVPTLKSPSEDINQ